MYGPKRTNPDRRDQTISLSVGKCETRSWGSVSLSLWRERGGGGSDDIPWDMICVYFPNEVVKFLSCIFVLLMWGLSGRCAYLSIVLAAHF